MKYEVKSLDDLIKLLDAVDSHYPIYLVDGNGIFKECSSTIDAMSIMGCQTAIEKGLYTILPV